MFHYLFFCIHSRNPNTRFSGKLLKASMETTTCTLTPPSYRTIISGSFPGTTCVSVSDMLSFIKIICCVCLILAPIIPLICHF